MYELPGFLPPVLTPLFLPKPLTTFSHASAEVRGENTPERKVASTGDRTHNHQVMSHTRSPLSLSGGAEIHEFPSNHSKRFPETKKKELNRYLET